MSEKTTFSVVVPTLNEAGCIGDTLRSIRAQEPDVELIVVDGGSRDETVAVAREAGARVHCAGQGRGLQCNMGAVVASRDILVFLHADTRLPAGAFNCLRQTFADDGVEVATFRLSFDRPHPVFTLYTFFSRFDSVFTSFGDQGIVIRRHFFEQLGGFPDWPLFEDVRLLQKARSSTCVRSIPATVVTSARRFEREGIIRQSLRNTWYVLRYLGGASPHRLAQDYEKSRPDARSGLLAIWRRE